MGKKISTYAKENELTYMAVWRMVKKDLLPHEFLPSGSIRIIDDMQETNNCVALYARVSSSENKNNLDKQLGRLESFAIAKGWTIKHSVKEIGSGLNDKRKKLEKLLTYTDYDILLVEHKDRFARFGTNYVSLLLSQTKRKLFIINEKEENSHEDLMQDFVSIITSFTARLYGLRRSKRKTEKMIKELNEQSI